MGVQPGRRSAKTDPIQPNLHIGLGQFLEVGGSANSPNPTHLYLIYILKIFYIILLFILLCINRVRIELYNIILTLKY